MKIFLSNFSELSQSDRSIFPIKSKQNETITIDVNKSCVKDFKLWSIKILCLFNFLCITFFFLLWVDNHNFFLFGVTNLVFCIYGY